MSDVNKNADFIRANKASSFFQSENVLFDRLKELGVIPESSDENKFQMIHTREEREALKKVLASVWDIYLVKKRRLERDLNKKKKKLERKKKKKSKLEKKCEEYEEKLENAENDTKIKSAKASLEIYEDRLTGTEETLISIEQKIENLESKMQDGSYDASLLKYDPELAPLWNELQNLVYDGRERARERYGVYATLPSSINGNNGNNGHKGDNNGRKQREQ